MSIAAEVLIVSTAVGGVIVLLALGRSHLRRRRIETLVAQEEMRREVAASGGFVAPPSDVFRSERQLHRETGHFSPVRPSGSVK